MIYAIRSELKGRGIKSNWEEMVGIRNTQKIITTYDANKAGIVIGIRK